MKADDSEQRKLPKQVALVQRRVNSCEFLPLAHQRWDHRLSDSPASHDSCWLRCPGMSPVRQNFTYSSAGI